MQRALCSSTSLKALACAFVCTAVSGCLTPPEQAPILAQPKTAPVRNITGFSASLRCMDKLFQQHGSTNYLITAQGIPDATGEISAGTKEMLITSVSQMSVQSNAFNFVDFESTGDVFVLGSFVAGAGGPPVPAGFEVPRYYIRGAISQLDSGVAADSIGGGIGIEQADIGASIDRVSSVVSVDLNVGDVLTRQMLPGVSANNSIVVTRSGRAADAGAIIEKAGLNFNLTFNRAEGMHQAVRTLIELSTIEVLGKLAQVPYWRCLEIDQTSSEVVAVSRTWFDSMGERDRVSFVQRALASAGYYNGPTSGALDPTTREAIGAYEAANGLLADGRVDYDLYAQLIEADLAVGREPDPAVVPTSFNPGTEPAASPIFLTLTTSRGPRHRFSPGEPVDVIAQATGDAFVYCYYEDASGTVSRIFPNRFQPDPYLPARTQLLVPGQAPFSLVPEQPGSTEQVLCVATGSEVGPSLPSTLRRDDLTPLPIADLDQIVTAFRTTGARELVEADVQIEIVP